MRVESGRRTGSHAQVAAHSYLIPDLAVPSSIHSFRMPSLSIRETRTWPDCFRSFAPAKSPSLVLSDDPSQRITPVFCIPTDFARDGGALNAARSPVALGPPLPMAGSQRTDWLSFHAPGYCPRLARRQRLFTPLGNTGGRVWRISFAEKDHLSLRYYRRLRAAQTRIV